MHLLILPKTLTHFYERVTDFEQNLTYISHSILKFLNFSANLRNLWSEIDGMKPILQPVKKN